MTDANETQFNDERKADLIYESWFDRFREHASSDDAARMMLHLMALRYLLSTEIWSTLRNKIMLSRPDNVDVGRFIIRATQTAFESRNLKFENYGTLDFVVR